MGSLLRPLGARLCSSAASSTPFMVSPRPLMHRALELLLRPPKHQAPIPSTCTLLDIGCGKGQVLAAAAELAAAQGSGGALEALRLRGIDYSEELCAATRTTLSDCAAARGLDVGVHCLSFSEPAHAASVASLVAEANLIYLFLDLGGVEAVAPLIGAHAAPGTRVVSIDFPLSLPEAVGGFKKTYTQAFDAMDVFLYER